MSTNHLNRRQVRIPARLLEDLMSALDRALTCIEILAPDPGAYTRQIHEFGQHTLAEARKRLQAQQ